MKWCYYADNKTTNQYVCIQRSKGVDGGRRGRRERGRERREVGMEEGEEAWRLDGRKEGWEKNERTAC